MGWKESKISMKPINCKLNKHVAIQDSKNIRNSTNRIKKILDASYENANLKNITSKLKYLSSEEQLLIFKLLTKHQTMFDGTLGNYTGTEYKNELQKGSQPYYATT